MHTLPDEFVIRFAERADIPRIQELWEALYQQQRDQGLRAPIMADGFRRWSDALAPMLGRFSALLITEVQGAVAGFLAARIRTPPPPFGGEAVGLISEVFVRETDRSRGIGKEMIQQALDWFGKDGISRVELQVLMRNEQARRFYRNTGWVEELVQMSFDPRLPKSC